MNAVSDAKPEKLRIAIQKSGRLSDDSLELLKACSVRFSRLKQKLKAEAYNFPAELLFLRDDDIPGYVADGVADCGIVGQNVLYETGHSLQEDLALGFGRCRLSIALPRGERYNGPASLAGKNIATSYPHLLQKWLSEQGIGAQIHEISGSVEIAPGIGLADAICDLVSTGSTLASNGLQEVESILRSEAVLISQQNLSEKKRNILSSLIFRIESVLQAADYRYILLNAPDDKISEITQILPGINSPTVMPLKQAGWSSVHSVVKEAELWPMIEQLRTAGAEGLLVLPIEKMFR